MNSILEYTHRAVALLTAFLVVAGAVVGWRRKESGLALRILPLIALAFIATAAVFGAFAVLTGLTPLLASIDLGSALIALLLIIATAVIASARYARPEAEAWTNRRTVLSTISLATLASFFAVIVSGILVARGSVMRCVGGPLHIGTWSSVADASWQYTSRQALGTIAALLAAVLVVTAVRNGEASSTTRRWAVLFGALFVAESALNAAMVSAGATAPLLIASVAATVASWSALVVVAIRAHMPERSRPEVTRFGAIASAT
jgi:heme A synthase